MFKIVILENRVLTAILSIIIERKYIEHLTWCKCRESSIICILIKKIELWTITNKIDQVIELLHVPYQSIFFAIFPSHVSDLYIRKGLLIDIQLGQQIRTVADWTNTIHPSLFPPPLFSHLQPTKFNPIAPGYLWHS